MTVSTKLVAGYTLSQDVAAPKDSEGVAYKASEGWALTYILIPRLSTSSVIQFSAVANGDDYRLAVAATDTASWTPGYYNVAADVALGLEKHPVEPVFVQVEILQNPRTAVAGFDGRSQAQKALDDAKRALADAQARAANVGTGGSASGGLIEYSIGERRFKYATAAEAVSSMIAAVDYWEKQLFMENRSSAIARGMADPRQVYVRTHRA